MKMATLDANSYFDADAVADRLQYRNAASVRQLVQRLADDGVNVGTKFSGVWVFTEVDVLKMEQFIALHGRVRRGKSA
jgi:hypothetical protein